MTAPECRNIEGHLTLWLKAATPKPPRQWSRLRKGLPTSGSQCDVAWPNPTGDTNLMATLNVRTGQAYATLSAAVAASRDSDIIAALAVTYVNDFVTISKDITIG